MFLSLLFNSLPDKVGSAMTSAFNQPEFQQAAGQAAGSNDPTVIKGYLGGLGAELTNDSAFLQKINPVLAKPFQQGFVDSTHLVYLLAGILMVIALGLVVALKEVPLRTMSAIDEQQAEQALLAAEEGLDPTELVDADGIAIEDIAPELDHGRSSATNGWDSGGSTGASAACDVWLAGCGV